MHRKKLKCRCRFSFYELRLIDYMEVKAKKKKERNAVVDS